MEDPISPALAQSSAARAFEDLRGEVSLLRRAIEGLTAERNDQPDYGPTLEALATSNEQIRAWAKKVYERPALQLSPQQIASQIEEATSRFRQIEQRQLSAESARLADAISQVRAISSQAQTKVEQVRREKVIGGVSFLTGALVWAILLWIQVAWM